MELVLPPSRTEEVDAASGLIASRTGKSCPCPPFSPECSRAQRGGVLRTRPRSGWLPGVFAVFVARSSVLERGGWMGGSFALSVGFHWTPYVFALGGSTEHSVSKECVSDRPPERLYIRGGLQFFGARSSVLVRVAMARFCIGLGVGFSFGSPESFRRAFRDGVIAGAL